jgi:succinate dehydrogenase / fumarate reductase cytochrome b subunit
MFLSGFIVLMFLVVHLGDFKFELGWGGAFADQTPYAKAGVILRDLARAIVYALGSVVLGVHVSHGLQSAFQSLGVNHPKYNGCIKWSSVVFGWIVAVGFASFPVVWSLSDASPSSAVPHSMQPMESQESQ